MAQNANREFDKTHLSIDTAEERVLVHRDYLAHCLRWSHVVKWLYKTKNYQRAKILDVGCGKEMPLGKLLYSNKMSGAKYCGIDINRLELPDMLAKANESGAIEAYAFGLVDATKVTVEALPFQPNVVACFEVFEHMAPRHAKALLENIFKLLEPDGVLFFSTPAWNGSAAANHINETKYLAVGALLEQVGFRIESNYGTFASIRDYEDELYEQYGDVGVQLFDKLREYYDTNVLSVIFAPLFPNEARNVLWVCSKGPKPSAKFPPLVAVLEPWSQHQDYGDFNAPSN